MRKNEVKDVASLKAYLNMVQARLANGTLDVLEWQTVARALGQCHRLAVAMVKSNASETTTTEVLE